MSHKNINIKLFTGLSPTNKVVYTKRLNHKMTKEDQSHSCRRISVLVSLPN